MLRLTLARGVLFLLSAKYSSNVPGQAGNLNDLTVASSQYDILLSSETLVPDMRHVSELLVPGLPGLVTGCWLPGQVRSAPRDGCTRTRWLRSISPT